MAVIVRSGASVRESSETIGALISSGCAISIISSGIATETTIMDHGSARVMSGGIANETRIHSGGTMYISEGGVANDTAVYSEGICHISSGGLAHSTTVNSNGKLIVLSGAAASDTIINYQGYTAIAGVANNIEVNGGSLIVDAGGTATAIKENGGSVEFAENATVSFVPNTISGRTLSGSASATLHSGTVALDTIMDFAYMYIYSGGVARNTLIDLGCMYISSGGLADFVTVVSGGRMLVSTGGIARNIFVYSSGSASISSGGIAEHITVNSGAVVSVFSSGTATIDFNPWAGGSVASETGANITYLERDAKIYLGGKGTGLLAKQDEMSGKIVSSGISAIVYDDGLLDNTMVMIGGTINVSSGGVAEDTTVSGGSVFLRGNASNTVMHGGYVYLYDNGYIYDTILNSGYLRISSGGIANGTSVSSDGYMYVSNGGTHRGSLQLNAGAVVSAYEGSTIDFTLTDRTPEDGYLINDLSLIQGAPTYTITVSANQAVGMYKLAQGASSFTGSITIGTETETYGTLTVNGEALNHQEATYSLVKEEGNLLLKIDQPAVFIYSSGTLISAGSVVTGEMLDRGKTMYISSGGVASSTTIDGFYGSAIMYVSSGGSATSTTVSSGGIMYISNGGVATSTAVINGSMFISSGGVANSTTVNWGGELYISSGGEANDTTVNSGVMRIYSGGTATNVIWTPCVGSVYVADGAYVTYTSQYSGVYFGSNNQLLSSASTMDNKVVSGSMYVMSGGVANNTTVNYGGYMCISSGGTANSTTVNGYMHISSGGTANSTTMSGGGMYIFSSGGVANNTTVNSSGFMKIISGGVANSTTVNSDGWMRIYSGGVANDTTVNSGGWMYVTSGGGANSTTVYSRGYMDISSGGIANSTTVNSGGRMRISSGGIYRGSLQLNAGAVVSAYEGSTIDFTLTDRTVEDGYLINDLSLITGAPTYTITVSANQAVGMYKLAQGVADFDQVITIGTELESYGTLTVNGAGLTVGKYIYSLELDGSSLSLNAAYSDIAGPILKISGNPTGWTNRDVVLTASASDSPSGLALIEYSLDNVDWIKGESVSVSKNGMVYFRATDNAGNITTQSVVVNRIDKTAPVNPLAHADVTTATNKDVIVSAIFSDDSIVREYKIGDGEWTTYTNAITMSANGTVYFRGQDTAGNWSDEINYEVTNIDREGPAVSEGVIVYGTFSEEAVTREYSIDGKNWLAYPEEGVWVIRTGMIYFRSLDDVGNVISTAEEKITTIPDENDWNDLKANGPEGKVDQMGVLHEGTIVAGHVGFGDQVDYYEFTLKSGACLNFYVESSDAAKFTIYTMNKSYSKSGDVSYSLKALQTTSISAGYTVPTKDLLLSEGTYYVAMSSNNSKTGGDANYRISVKESTTFYTKGDQTDNWNDMKEAGADGAVGDAGVITETGFANKLVSGGWVGYGDSVDYVKFTLEDAAKLNFNVSSSDNLKFTVYRLDEKYNSRTGVSTYSIKALQTASVQPDHTIMTKDLLLEAGTYYIGMTSPNAAKGGDADYNVWLNSDHTKFFTKADNSDDVFTDAKVIDITETNSGWVGFGDSVDYMKFTVDTAAKLNFDVTTSDSAKFVIYQADDKTGKLKALQTTTLKADAVTPTKDLFLTAGTYYIGMTSTNAKKGGDADYSFNLNSSAVFYPEAGDNSDDTWKLVQNDEAVKLNGANINGWVGYSDAADFMKLELDGSGAIKLELDDVTADAYEGKQLKITCADEKGKAIALTYDAATESFTSNLTFTEGIVCYIGVSTADQKKYDTEYQITAGILA